MECKENSLAFYNIRWNRINRNIMECKVEKREKDTTFRLGINRNIMECKAK